MAISTIRIDGSTGEGGGQVVRTALALAAVVGETVEIVEIRAGRSEPGLAAQHLTAARALATVCDGELVGDAFGSTELRFRPGPVRPGRYAFDVAAERPSAGATTLVAQALLPPLVRAEGPVTVRIAGGTHVKWSPTVEHTAGPLAQALRRVGVGLDVELLAHGWYPKGGGEIEMTVTPAPRLEAVAWERPDAGPTVRGRSVAANLSTEVAERQAESASRRLRQEIGDASVDLETERVGGRGKGTACYLECRYGEAPLPPAGVSSLGEPGLPAEKVGVRAAELLIEHHRDGGAVDVHLADQILPFLSMAVGRSRFTVPRVTSHLRSVAAICRAILGASITIREADRTAGDSGPASVEVDGVGI